ncbi:hypothetical protein [Xanthomonas vasicola]|uniref:hypothetical protein n=1 Tax=Xanthomonas vasicola TaxID=56459 RepID=UPI0021BD3A3B|nr:hypothetical protein [Xanthomonas vasicola]
MDSLAAIGGEALGLQVIERAATRALDLDFIEGAGLAQQAGALATTEVLESPLKNPNHPTTARP